MAPDINYLKLLQNILNPSRCLVIHPDRPALPYLEPATNRKMAVCWAAAGKTQCVLLWRGFCSEASGQWCQNSPNYCWLLFLLNLPSDWENVDPTGRSAFRVWKKQQWSSQDEAAARWGTVTTAHSVPKRLPSIQSCDVFRGDDSAGVQLCLLLCHCLWFFVFCTRAAVKHTCRTSLSDMNLSLLCHWRSKLSCDLSCVHHCWCGEKKKKMNNEMCCNLHL